jgi:RNA polymerase sigma factor (sigma-70 family)
LALPHHFFVNLFQLSGTNDVDITQLVLRIRGEDLAAAPDLLVRHGDRLLRFAFLLCGSEAAAQDLVQETFLQALRSARRFRGQSSVYTWLQGILVNLSRHHHREANRMVYDHKLLEQAPAVAGEEPLPLDVEMATSALRQALGQLSALHREVLVLRYYEGMKVHEIARHLRISRGTVKSRLHYAIAEMQQLLPKEMNLFGAGGTERREPT